MMTISKNFRIVEEGNNCVLQFFEQRIKKKKTGEEVPYEYTEDYFYPNLKTALKAYLNKEVKGCQTIEQVLERIDYAEYHIEQLINRKK